MGVSVPRAERLSRISNHLVSGLGRSWTSACSGLFTADEIWWKRIFQVANSIWCEDTASDMTVEPLFGDTQLGRGEVVCRTYLG